MPVPERFELIRWVEGVRVKRQWTQAEIARAAGLSESAFSRQIKAGSLGLPPLLKLARATGESASAILRMAGKGEIAELIEDCFGLPHVVPAVVREFDEIAHQQPPLPDDVVRATLQPLKAFRAALLEHSGGGNAPAAAPQEGTRTRAKRGARQG